MFRLVRDVDGPDLDGVEDVGQAMGSTEVVSSPVPLFTSDSFNNPIAPGTVEASATDAERSDTNNDAISVDKPAAFPNSFEVESLQERKRNAGVIVTGHSGIGETLHFVGLESVYATSRFRQKYSGAPHPHFTPTCSPSHYMTRHRHLSHVVHQRRHFPAFL